MPNAGSIDARVTGNQMKNRGPAAKISLIRLTVRPTGDNEEKKDRAFPDGEVWLLSVSGVPSFLYLDPSKRRCVLSSQQPNQGGS